MNDAGVCSASSFTLEAAGWMRCRSASKSSPPLPRDDDLAVHDAALREVGLGGGDDLREVAGHRLLVAAADLHLVAVAKDDRPKAVPLGLVMGVGRDPLHRLGQHRRDGGHDRQLHVPIFTRPQHASGSRLKQSEGEMIGRQAIEKQGPRQVLPR